MLKEQTRQSKDAITEETLKINAIQTANEKIEVSIEQLVGRQRAWVSKHKQDQDKLANAIDQQK